MSAHSPASCSPKAGRSPPLSSLCGSGQGARLVGPGTLVVRRRDPEDERGQVRQEGTSGRARKRRARDRRSSSPGRGLAEHEGRRHVRRDLGRDPGRARHLGRAARRRGLRLASRPAAQRRQACQDRPGPRAGKAALPGPQRRRARLEPRRPGRRAAASSNDADSGAAEEF